jgi:hypothetical protein
VSMSKMAARSPKIRREKHEGRADVRARHAIGRMTRQRAGSGKRQRPT